jgi:sulfur carrier protein
MQITVNGVREDWAEETPLTALIEAKGLARRFLLVEHNGEPVARDEFPQRILRDGDRLELVRPVAGG